MAQPSDNAAKGPSSHREAALSSYLQPEGEHAAPGELAPLTCRFAPSPTGRMHAGNIFASLASWLLARKTGGKVVLRIEDLDRDRSKDCFIDQVARDYEALGLDWDEGPYFQRNRDAAYQEAFAKLEDTGLVYPCFCTRADLHAASAPHAGQSSVYAGTCRNLTADERAAKAAEAERAGRLGPSYRLAVPPSGNAEGAFATDDVFQGPCRFDLGSDSGDFVVRRSDLAFAYQLAVVVDDAEHGVTCVVRGIDLVESVPRQMYLQRLLGFSHPLYAHVPLLVAEDGRRLAKRNRDAGFDALLEEHKTPEGVLGYIAGVTGLKDDFEPASAQELLEGFDVARCRARWQGKISITWPSAR